MEQEEMYDYLKDIFDHQNIIILANHISNIYLGFINNGLPEHISLELTAGLVNGIMQRIDFNSGLEKETRK